MSEEQDSKPPKIKEGAKLETLSFGMRVVFHPEIRLDTKRGHDFTKTLSEVFVPTQTDFKSDSWEFVLPQGLTPDCFTSVTVEPSNFQFHVSRPDPGMEAYETKFAMLLRRFKESFKPELIMQSSTMINGTLEMDGDARDYLADCVVNMEPNRIKPFGRPIRLLGLRFFFPPFKLRTTIEKGKGKKKVVNETLVDWQVNVRIESLLEDTKKLFLQAEADWVKPRKWTEAEEKSILGQLDTVADYLEKNVIAFLQNKPKADPESEGGS